MWLPEAVTLDSCHLTITSNLANQALTFPAFGKILHMVRQISDGGGLAVTATEGDYITLFALGGYCRLLETFKQQSGALADFLRNIRRLSHGN